MKLKKILNGESGISKEDLTVKGDTRMKATIVPFSDITDDLTVLNFAVGTTGKVFDESCSPAPTPTAVTPPVSPSGD